MASYRVLLHCLQSSLGKEGVLVLSVPKACYGICHQEETLRNWHVAFIHWNSTVSHSGLCFVLTPGSSCLCKLSSESHHLPSSSKPLGLCGSFSRCLVHNCPWHGGLGGFYTAVVLTGYTAVLCFKGIHKNRICSTTSQTQKAEDS